MKSGDLSTVWWVCVWQGRVRVFRNIADANAKVSGRAGGQRWVVCASGRGGGRNSGGWFVVLVVGGGVVVVVVVGDSGSSLRT